MFKPSRCEGPACRNCAALRRAVNQFWWIPAVVAVVIALGAESLRAESGSETQLRRYGPPATVQEARDRARILHETIHGALQVVHRDFFDEDDAHTLPSQSLEDVFLELQRSYGVSIRWISVNAKAMNVDHQPEDEFEKKAALALSQGKHEYEVYNAGEYRHVGPIRMASQCLKCHVPNRTSTEDRIAGLSITMKVADRPVSKGDH